MGNNHKGFCMGVFWGALVGAAIGILYAPRKGEETRQILTEKALDIGDKINEAVEEIREKAAEVRKEGEKLLKPTPEP